MTTRTSTTTASNGAMYALPLLPAPLFRLVIAFALFESDSECVATPRPSNGRTRLPLSALRDLALVAKSWSAPVRDVLALHRLSKLTIDVQTTTRTAFAQHRHNALLRGPFVRDLTISMGRYNLSKSHFELHTGLHFVETVALPWTELLRHMPDLQRLDISKLPLASRHTLAIINAAATFCPSLVALLLPCELEDLYADEGDDGAVVASVYTALQRWRQRGGLRLLSFPDRGEAGTDDERTIFSLSTTYVDALATHCPAIEYIESHKHTLCELDRLTTTDKWYVPLDTWTRFCAACTHLRAFNWIVAPFDDAFFHAFGAYTKPQLTHLTFAINMLWRWDIYFPTITSKSDSDAMPQLNPRYGKYATNASAVLQACPALKELEVCFYHPVDTDVMDDPEMMYEINNDEDYAFIRSTWPTAEVWNANNLFNDAFCVAAATHCRHLERVSFWEVAERYNATIEPIATLTDVGLAALATLPWLQYIELRAVNCTGRGLLALLTDFPTVCTAQRNVQIAIGGDSGPTTTTRQFYTAIKQLLTLLVKADTPLAFANRKVVLRVVNASHNTVNTTWSRNYLRKLKQLIQQMQQKHPTIALRCVITKRRRQGFASLSEFGVFTASATPSVWHGWDECEQEATATTGGASRVFLERGSSRNNARARDDDITYVDGDSDDGVSFDRLLRRQPYPILYGDARAEMLENLPIDFEPSDAFLAAYGGGSGGYDERYGDGYDEYDDDFGYDGYNEYGEFSGDDLDDDDAYGYPSYW